MRTAQKLTVTLPDEMASLVKAKVSECAYATDSEVTRDGLRALMGRDRTMENWLQNQVGPASDALQADPTRAVTTGQLRKRLAAEQSKAITKA